MRASRFCLLTPCKDFSDAGFNRESPREVAEATYQRVREVKIAVEEVRVLQEELFKCYHRHAPDHYHMCKDLAMEYKRRIRQDNLIPPVGYPASTSRLRRTEDGKLVYEHKN